MVEFKRSVGDGIVDDRATRNFPEDFSTSCASFNCSDVEAGRRSVDIIRPVQYRRSEVDGRRSVHTVAIVARSQDVVSVSSRGIGS